VVLPIVLLALVVLPVGLAEVGSNNLDGVDIKKSTKTRMAS
jgi:hypothetical protein